MILKSLRKAILNLLGNAFKFTESGEIIFDIQTRTLENKSRLTISIHDTGIGIPKGQEEVIFQRFSRALRDDVQNPTGTGIGLALVREIVNMHQGRVWAETSHAEGGAKFNIEMPIGPVSGEIPVHKSSYVGEETSSPYIAALVGEGNNLDVLSLPEFSPGKKAARQGETDVLVHNAASILIVEDNHDMREYIASILRVHFPVIMAENGSIGLELARKYLPGLILSDVMMPELDGLQMLAELRKYEDTKMTPVVLLSAKSELTEKLEGLGLGADDYIAKPFRPAELLLKIKNLLHKNSLIELEKHKERESVFSDLHDYLGGSLTDMTIMVKRIKNMFQMEKKEVGLPEDQIEQLDTIVKQAVINYKQCFAKIEELNHLQGEFIEGLKLILYGRYSNFDREIIFQGEKFIDLIFQDQRNNSLKQVLYAVIMEIVTNDLKYGMGLSRWKLGLSETNEFLLDFSASTDLSKMRPQAGRGTGNIQRRVKNAGGVVQVTADAGLYHLDMRIPLPI